MIFLANRESHFVNVIIFDQQQNKTKLKLVGIIFFKIKKKSLIIEAFLNVKSKMFLFFNQLLQRF
ncbi:hypothetical protein DM790_21920 [Flavobacterium collinsii]|nr:hypothetical protein [Flavobacterium collinsii]